MRDHENTLGNGMPYSAFRDEDYDFDLPEDELITATQNPEVQSLKDQLVKAHERFIKEVLDVQ